MIMCLSNFVLLTNYDFSDFNFLYAFTQCNKVITSYIRHALVILVVGHLKCIKHINNSTLVNKYFLGNGNQILLLCDFCCHMAGG